MELGGRDGLYVEDVVVHAWLVHGVLNRVTLAVCGLRRMTHLDLLHRARNALQYPTSDLNRWALIHEITETIGKAYPKPVTTYCWCGEKASVQGGHCNEHSEFQLGDG